MPISRILSAAVFAVAVAMVPLAAVAQDSSPEVVAVSGGAVAIFQGEQVGGVVVLPPEGGGPITDSDQNWFVSTEGTLGVDGYVSSEASLVLGEAGISSWCVADATGVTGGAQLAGDFPPEFPENPAPNTVVEFEGETAILNEQIISEDGLSITVNALRANVPVGDDIVELLYAQSTCGVVLADEVPVTPVDPADDAAEPARVVPRFTG